MTKKTKILSLLLAAAMLFGMAMAMPAMAAEMISVPNGDFEAETTAGTWSLTNATLATVEDGTVYEGEKFMRLTGSGAHCVSAKIAVDASAEYVLDFALRTGDTPCAYTVVYFYDAEGNAVTGADGNSSKGNSSYGATKNAWETRSDTFATPANTASVVINLRTNTSAGEGDTVDYDAVRLIKKDANEKVTNGDMETGDLSGWTVSDATKITADDTNADTGIYAMKLLGSVKGETITATQKLTFDETIPVGSWAVSVRVKIPNALTEDNAGFRIGVMGGSNNYTHLAFGGSISSNAPSGYRTTKTDGYVTYTAYLGFDNYSQQTSQIIKIELCGVGEVYVDNVSVAPIGGRIIHGGFEEEVGGRNNYLGGWYVGGVPTGGVTRTTERAYSGKASMKIDGTVEGLNGKSLYYYTIGGLSKEAGVYRLDYMYYLEAGTTGKVPALAVYTFGTGNDDYAKVRNAETGKWQKGTTYLYKAQDAETIVIRVGIYATEGAMYLDDISFSKDTSALEFQDKDGMAVSGAAKATSVWYHHVQETEATALPVAFVAAYKKTGEKQQLVEVIPMETPSAALTTHASYSALARNWYAYDYKLDLPEETDATSYKAFVWDSFAGLVPVENAVSTAN